MPDTFICDDCHRRAHESQWAEWHGYPRNESGERICDDCAEERIAVERVEKPEPIDMVAFAKRLCGMEE
jgi:uncharacterized protein YlaI